MGTAAAGTAGSPALPCQSWEADCVTGRSALASPPPAGDGGIEVSDCGVLGLATELTPGWGSTEEAEHREPCLWLLGGDGKTGQKMLDAGRSSILGDAVGFQSHAPGLGLWLTNAEETGPSAGVLRMNCAARTDGGIAQGLRCPVVVY